MRSPAGTEAEEPRGPDDRGSPQDAARPPDPPPPSEPGDSATDRWLGQQLRRLYDDVAGEPIPDEFLSILARMKGRKAETDPSS